MTVTKEHISIMREAKSYRIKQFIDSDGDDVFYIQRKRFGIWWNMYILGRYEMAPWILELIFGSPKRFYKFKDAKDWVMRRLRGEEIIYHYYPFEDNSN